MPDLYGVVVQPITNETGAANVERYGEVIDIGSLMDKDTRGRDFCDGQTSPLPPMYADDQAGMIYSYSREAADLWSGVLRDDLAQRVAAGQLTQAPSWIASTGASVLAAETLPVAIDGVREAGEIAAAVTDSQIQTQIQAYVTATGNPNPSTADLLAWIRDNARWVD